MTASTTPSKSKPTPLTWTHLERELEAYSYEQAIAHYSAAVTWAAQKGLRRREGGKYLLGQNSKMRKQAEEKGYLVYGVSLASGDKAGHIVCQTAVSKRLECAQGRNCLFFAGNGRFPSVQKSRVKNTNALFDNPLLWTSLLATDLRLAQGEAEARDLQLAVRLNVLSDIPWERIAPWLFESFPGVTFYDYTKEAWRFAKEVPDNYHLVLSAHEKMGDMEIEEVCAQGGRVAVVFPSHQRKAKLPPLFCGYPVRDGDENDLIFLCPPGYIIGLRAKGDLQFQVHSDKSRFVRKA